MTDIPQHAPRIEREPGSATAEDAGLQMNEGKLDSLATDHTALLQASIRSLELLGVLESVARRLLIRTQENGTSSSPQLTSLQAKLDRLSREWDENLDKRDAATLEAFATVSKLIQSLKNEWDSKLDHLRRELEKTSQLASEYLPLHVKTSAFCCANPEVGLLIYLHNFLPTLTAVDVGAHRGEISLQLLNSGYEVYAFEPYPPSFETLSKQLAGKEQCHIYNCGVAAADTTMQLYIADDTSSNHQYVDASLFNSLVQHSMPPDLRFTSSMEVTVRSLFSLAAEGRIPFEIGVLKVDTEGYDSEVLAGLGDLRPYVVVAEFWSPDFVFARQGALNDLNQLIPQMRARGYQWYVVLYRPVETNTVSFYCNHEGSVSNSWGNVVFFRDRHLFMRAQEWCSSILPATFLNVPTDEPLHLAHRSAKSPEIHAELEAVRTLLGKQDEEIATGLRKRRELEQLLSRRDEEIATALQKTQEFEQLLRKRDEEIATALQKRWALEQLLGSLEQGRKRVESELQHSELELSHTKFELDRIKLELQNEIRVRDELKTTISTLDNRITRIKGSLSWKLTSPLREIRRAVGKCGRYLIGHDKVH
jgi:FkbM family methyltransferase